MTGVAALDPIPPEAPRIGLSIRALLDTPVARDPGAEIVYRDSVRLTYRDLHERVRRLAAALHALGVGPGDTVGVLEHDSHRYLEVLLAVPAMGAVVHTINARLSSEQILYTIQHAEDDVLLLHADFLPVVEAFRGRIDVVRKFVVITDGAPASSASIPLAGDYETLLAEAPAHFAFPEVDEDARATTFFTTGTTGLPKCVSFSHRQIVLHTLATAATLAAQHHGSLRRGDVYMPITPMFHVHAWGIPFVATFLGLKQVYPGRWSPEELLALIAREGVTFSHCVPTVLHMLLEAPSATRVDLSRWKVLVGGAPLRRALAERALARGIDVVTAYGMSETCPLLTLGHLDPPDLAAPPFEQLAHRTRTGRPLPLVDLRVVDGDRREVPRDGRSTGEITVRAPWLTSGYRKDRWASARLWDGGVLHTGDLAVRDARGFVNVTDRLKDVVKVGGEWISSLAVEDALATHPAVADVAVIAAPDARWGERPLALVVRNPSAGDAAERELVAHARAFHERGLLPRQVALLRVRFVDAIEKTSVGKVNKRALRDRYCCGQHP